MKYQFLQSSAGVTLLAGAILIGACSRLVPAAPASGKNYIPLTSTPSTQQTSAQQEKPSGAAVSEFAPISYFESNCARCHGAYGAFYGEGFGQGLTDNKLRQAVHDMAAGPGNAPISEPQLDALTAYHRSLIDGKPFLIINAARAEKDASHTLQGETTPETKISLQWEGGTADATVEGYTWSAKLPATIDWSKVEIISKKGDAQTVLKPGENEYSHRASLDKTDSASTK
jgi:mono/diheme cytochrome c family protein